MPSSTIPHSESAVIITIEGLDQYWETFSGIKDSASTSDEYSDGLSNRLYKIEGPRSLDEMDVSKAFDRKADKPILEFWLNRQSGRDVIRSMTISLCDYTPEPTPAESFVLYGVRAVGLEIAQADKKSNNVMRLMLKLIADDWKIS